MKFPSQNKLDYQTGADISNDTWGAVGIINLPKDLSLINRRGYASCKRDGTPYVFRRRVDLYGGAQDGTGTTSAVGTDFFTTLKIDGAQNTWVMKNASKAWASARKSMLKAAGISQKQLGAYAKEIRYNYNANENTYISPVDAYGDAFQGGTWDDTKFVTEADPEFSLKLVGDGTDEDAAVNTSVVNMAYSYLSSRQTVPADSNIEATEVPAVNSILRQINNFSAGIDRAEQSYIETDVKGQGDNPPYDEFASADTTNDITEEVELGRCLASPGAQVGSMIVDIPFGLANIRAQHFDAADTNTVHRPYFTVTVESIYEMQG